MTSIAPNHTSAPDLFGRDIYTDVNQLNQINRIADKDQHAALKKMAKQFEGLFIQLMLKTMREANAVFAEEQSSEMEFHQSMFDNQLALNLSSDRGIGLADQFYQNMVANYSDKDDPRAIVKSNPFTDQPRLRSSAKTHINRNLEPIPTGPEAFVAAVRPHAERVASALGIDPDVIIAQSALETGWGKHVITDKQGQSSYNLFNIKADGRWTGDKVNIPTVEYRNGVAQRERANFRRYDSLDESFNDYARFILSEPRYQGARQSDNGADYIRALHDMGYATDPHYADKVIELLNNDVIRNSRDKGSPSSSETQGRVE